MNSLLHTENLRRVPVFGKHMLRQLAARVDETRQAASELPDPDVSIIIRSKNHVRQLESLLGDIQAQNFSGEVEIIVVDTESSDGSVALAKKFGARVLTIKQAHFSYPKALNLGFEAATKPWIFSLVDHSALSSRYVLKTAARWDTESKLGAVWAFGLPDANATIWEQLGYVIWVDRSLSRPAHDARRHETGAGLLSANDLLIRRSAWQEAGGFDERFAAGGEDSALGRVLLQAGYRLAYDPGLSVYHSHNLGFIDSARQVRYWRRLDRPATFDLTELRRYRSDL